MARVKLKAYANTQGAGIALVNEFALGMYQRIERQSLNPEGCGYVRI